MGVAAGPGVGFVARVRAGSQRDILELVGVRRYYS